MDQFRIKFLEEAADLLDDLERILLDLENKGSSSESMEQIFRVMHTIKGSSSMFGFDSISEFTHDLETIYDYIRSGKMEISREILDVTLLSLDHIRNLLKDDALEQQENVLNQKSLKEKISHFISSEDSVAKPEMKVQAIKEHVLCTYYILFKPQKDILLNGSNPLYLLNDLTDMGPAKIIWHLEEIGDFMTLNLKECDIYWEIFLATEQSLEKIKEVFIFVEDKVEIHIEEIKNENLFLQETFIDYLKQIPANSSFVDLIHLRNFLESKTEAGESSSSDTTSALQKAQASKESGGSSIRVSSDKLDSLLNLVSELVTTQARLSLYANNNVAQAELNTIAENIEKISKQLRDNTFSICLIPIDNLITRFTRLIRDLSKQLHKKVKFTTEGTETEIDKTIVDSLTDPLMHIFRNCIDHGIENGATRLQKGKPEEGTISLHTFYSGTNVHIQIKDDGAGINTGRIREKAIAKGLISPDAQLSEKEIYDLMFLPGFSTASQVTEVSGRGVGMDVVKRQINAIRGSVTIESVVDKGTTITLILPLTLSIIDGLLVEIQQTKYVIPLVVVNKCVEVKTEEITGLFDNTIEHEGELIPFLNLREVFGIQETAPEVQQMIIVENDNKHIGFTVDFVIGEYQAVLKPLGKLYQQTDIMSGATILGDGSIALVVDAPQLIRKYASQQVLQY